MNSKKHSHVLHSQPDFVRMSQFGEQLIKSGCFSNFNKSRRVKSQVKELHATSKPIKKRNNENHLIQNQKGFMKRQNFYQSWKYQHLIIERRIGRKMKIKNQQNLAQYKWNQKTEEYRNSINDILTNWDYEQKTDRIRKKSRLVRIKNGKYKKQIESKKLHNYSQSQNLREFRGQNYRKSKLTFR